MRAKKYKISHKINQNEGGGAYYFNEKDKLLIMADKM